MKVPNGLVVVSMLMAAGAARAQIFDFTGANGQRWHDEDNWAPQGIPGTGSYLDAIVFVEEAKGPVVIDLATPLFLKTVLIDGLEMHGGEINFSTGGLIRGLLMDRGRLIPFQGSSVQLEDLSGSPCTLTSGATVVAGPGEVESLGTLQVFSARVEQGTLVNRGTMDVADAGALTIVAPGSVWNYGSMQIARAATVSSSGVLSNEGQLDVDATAGVVNINTPYYQGGGTLRVIGGECRLTSDVNLFSGEVELGQGGFLRLNGASRSFISLGRIHGAGRMLVWAQGMAVEHPVSVALDGGFELSGPAWLYDRLTNEGLMVCEGQAELLVGPVYNSASGVLDIAALSVSTGELFNEGTLSVRPGATLRVVTKLDNSPLGVVGVGEGSNIGNDTRGHVDNRGRIEKTGAGSTPAAISAELLQRSGGATRVLEGSLEVAGGGLYENGRFETEAGGQLRLYNFSGTRHEVTHALSFSGMGAATLGAAGSDEWMIVRPGATLTLEMPGQGFTFIGTVGRDKVDGGGAILNTGQFSWRGGTIGAPSDDTSVTNAGVMQVGCCGVLYADLTNSGAVSQTGDFQLGGTVINEAGWRFDSSSAINDWGGTFVNSGAVTHDTGGASVVRAEFSNEESGGTVHVARGALSFTNVTQVTQESLAGGSWSVASGAVLNLPRPIGTIRGTARISGAGQGRTPFLIDVEKVTEDAALEFAEKLAANRQLIIDGRARIVVHENGVVEFIPGIDHGGGADGEPSPGAEIQQKSDGGGFRAAPVVRTSTLDNHARLLPGGPDGAGPFNLDGGLVMHPTGRIVCEIGGRDPLDEHDQMAITGDAALGGTLEIALLDEFTPALGDSFTVLAAAGGLSGEFEALDAPALPGGLGWELSYSPTAVTISVVEACTPDWNGDGAVNTQDFIAYLNSWTAGEPRADLNGDGLINTQDFIAFLNLWTAGC